MDIAKKRDFFAFMVFFDNAVIVEGNKTLDTNERLLHYYDIQLIEQYQGMRYREMVERVARVMGHKRLSMNSDLVVDGTGVGEAVIEMMRERGLYPVPILFSGGNEPREHYAGMGEVFGDGKFGMGAKVLKEISVPKKDLVTAAAILLQGGRVRLAQGRWNDEFRKQLERFKGILNEDTRRRRYEAETENDHDDLVACFLMGAWWIQNRRRKDTGERVLPAKDASAGWEPDEYM